MADASLTKQKLIRARDLLARNGRGDWLGEQRDFMAEVHRRLERGYTPFPSLPGSAHG